jgi:CheY-like chemotaxis protein
MLSVTGKQILIVEDDEDIVDLFLIVMQEGNQVDVANNGAEALTKIRANKDYDLIISDFHMPLMDGARLHNEIKLFNPKLAQRMFFVTGEQADSEMHQLIGVDKFRFLCKPFGIKDLRQKIENFFNERRTSDVGRRM